MNKQKFIDYLRSPERLTEGQFSELQKLLVDHPYFSIARSITARAAKDLELAEKNGLIASAAIYATDRKHLKKYINGDLVFLVEKPIVTIEEEPEEIKQVAEDHEPEEIAPTTESSHQHDIPESKAKSSGNESVEAEVDQIIDELQRDITDLKKSRMHFVDIQNQIDEEESLSRDRPTKPAEDVVDAAETISSDIPTHSELEPINEPVQDESPELDPISAKTTEKIEDDQTEAEEKITKHTAVKFDLDALKRELAREEDEKDKEGGEKEKDLKKEIRRAKREELRAKEAEEEDEELKEAPAVVNVPGSITNMGPGEENDEDENAEIRPLSRRSSSRKPRKPIAKIKREDLEKILGKKSAPSKEKTEEIKPVAVEKTPKLSDTLKEEEPSDIAPKESVPTTSEETTSIDSQEKKSSLKSEVESDIDTKKEKAKKPKKEVEDIPAPVAESKVEESKVEIESKSEPKELPSAKPKAEPEEIETTAAKPTETAIPKEDEPARNSIKAFLDLGNSVERTSVSRSSSSRSKRSARANRSRPSSDEGKSDGKDDDESGGANSLIEKFIQENPSIQRRQVTDEKADLSQDSTKWNPELASEHLAQIYLDQGNTKRAILIYETLSLKFPEKKSYFAGLIEKLKK